MIGRKASLGILVATLAPKPEPIKAGTAIAKANLKSGFILRRYDAVAPKVPRNEGSLLVPSSKAGEVLGIEINKEGN